MPSPSLRDRIEGGNAEQQCTDEMAGLVGKDDPTPADVERIGRLLNG